ncbi:Arylsulfatase [Crateriforma conspicua]|nr:Arylsulfatase [Crateriforma conspicua]
MLVCGIGVETTHASDNVLLILADDLGWADLGCYGNPWFETPHLDRLASEGVRFTQAYSAAPICSASRASLLTGKSTARLGFEFVTKDRPGYQPVVAPLRAPPFTLDLPLREVTVAECLRDAGYETAFFGKWHLNRHHERYLGWSPTHGPAKQGFQVAEEDFGCHPYSYYSDHAKRGWVEIPDGEFPVDSMTRRAIGFLKKPHAGPFFLMVSHFYVHTPVHTRVKWLYDRCLAKIPEGHPRREALANYGAMVTTLDHHVGELLAALDASGHADTTLVVFTSDNGGHPEYAGNAPLRGSKWNLYEGGIRVPFLARWPGKTPPGETSAAMVTGTDLFPTFAEVGKASLPGNLDGQSVVPVFLNPESSLQPMPVVWHFPYYHPERRFAKTPRAIGIDDGYTSQTRPHSAMRSGSWKLMHFYEDGRDELYHLPTDLSEQTERSQSDPAMAKQFRADLEHALKQRKARMPIPHPDWQSPSQ